MNGEKEARRSERKEWKQAKSEIRKVEFLKTDKGQNLRKTKF